MSFTLLKHGAPMFQRLEHWRVPTIRQIFAQSNHFITTTKSPWHNQVTTAVVKL